VSQYARDRRRRSNLADGNEADSVEVVEKLLFQVQLPTKP
jgi:hypothetical protein